FSAHTPYPIAPRFFSLFSVFPLHPAALPGRLIRPPDAAASQTSSAGRERLQLHRQFDSSAARYRLFGLAQATFLVLAPAAAGARVVAPGRGPDLSVAPTHKLHHKGGRLAPPPERDHFLHIRVDMIKEVPVPLAK